MCTSLVFLGSLCCMRTYTTALVIRHFLLLVEFGMRTLSYVSSSVYWCGTSGVFRHCDSLRMTMDSENRCVTPGPVCHHHLQRETISLVTISQDRPLSSMVPLGPNSSLREEAQDWCYSRGWHSSAAGGFPDMHRPGLSPALLIVGIVVCSIKIKCQGHPQLYRDFKTLCKTLS